MNMAIAPSIRRPCAHLRDATEELVTITVTYEGSRPHHYIKRRLLCETSAWFKHKLEDEAISQVMFNVNADGSECLKHYIHWLETGTIASENPQHWCWVYPKSPNGDAEYRLLIALWHFGQNYGISGLQDATISAMVARMESSKAAGDLVLPCKTCINSAYHQKAILSSPRRPSNKLQEIFVEVYATQDSSTHFQQIEEEVSPFFLADLCKRQNALLQSSRRNLKRLAEDNACNFHQHGTEEACGAGEAAAAKRQQRE